jgi:preprotein translocase subunit SecA
MDRLGLKEGEVITHSMVSKSIERAQKKIESRNFSMRKNLIEYDDVMNNQRSVVYDRRNQALGGKSVRDEVRNILNDYLDFSFNLDGGNTITKDVKSDIMETLSIDYSGIDGNTSNPKKIKESIIKEADKILDMKSNLVGDEIFEQFQKFVIFKTIDQKWKEHLHSMDQLREGINLRAYGQKNPLVEYKQEGYEMFTEMMIDTNQETLKRIFRSNIATPDESQVRQAPKNVNLSHDKMPIDFATPPPQSQSQNLSGGSFKQRRPQAIRPIQSDKKYGRNDKVKVSNGSATKIIKYKKAESLINEGWKIVE